MGQSSGTLRRRTTSTTSFGTATPSAFAGGTVSGVSAQTIGTSSQSTSTGGPSTTTAGVTASGGSSGGATGSSTSTTGPNIHRALGDGEINYTKGLKAIDEISRLVMTMFFKTHFQGGQQPIKDWLAQKNWSNSELKKRGFMKEQLDVINAGTQFPDMDISLKYALLLHCCDFNISPPEWKNHPSSEEYSLYHMKQKRNEFSHDRKNLIDSLRDPVNFQMLFDELKDISFKALDKLRIYLIGQGQPVVDIDQCEVDVEAHLDALKFQDIIVEVDPTQAKLKGGMAEVVDQQKQLLEIEPFPHILGLAPFRLQDIYENPDLYVEKRGLLPEDTQKIPLLMENLLTTPLVGSSNVPRVICVEGPSGVGKSTLLARVVSDRLDPAGTITGLKSFDLVLHFACKRKHCRTLRDLIKSSLPLATRDISDDLLLRAVRNLSLLVMADGFDEVSVDGRILLEDLYQEASSSQLRVILTTRTGSLEEAESIMGSLKYLRVTLSALSPRKSESMASKHYGALHTKMNSPPPEAQVVKDVCFAAERLARTPRNILLLTYLACVQPEKVKAPLTLPELLDTLDEISLKMLRQRLHRKDLSQYEMENEIRLFTRDLNAAALQNLLERETDIPTEDLRRIANQCRYPTDMLDTFLSCRWEQKVAGDQASYVFPHQSQLEYRAALGVCDRLGRNYLEEAATVGLSLTTKKDPIHGRRWSIVTKFRRLFKVKTAESAQDQHQQEELNPNTVLCHILRLKARDQGESKELLDYLWNFLLSLVGALRLRQLLSRHAEEMAELVVSSCKRSPDEALEAIGQGGMDKTFTEAVTSKLDREWTVTKHLHVLKDLHVFPSEVTIKLFGCCNDEPQLAEALGNVRKKDVTVDLLLYSCLREMCFQGCCTWPIQALTAPGALCTVRKLDGPWGPCTTLQPSVKDLILLIHSPEGLVALQRQINVLPHLDKLVLHVSAAVGDKPLGAPLKKKVEEIVLYDVTSSNWRWTVNFLVSLHAQGEFGDIIFYANDLTITDYRCLIKEWAVAGVKSIDDIHVSSTHTWHTWEKEYNDLVSLVSQKFKANFYVLAQPNWRGLTSEQTGSVVGQDSPATQKLQFLVGFSGSLPHMLDKWLRDCMLVELPRELSVPYIVQVKLRATREESMCNLLYRSPNNVNIFFTITLYFDDDIILLMENDPYDDVDIPSIRLIDCGLQVDTVHSLAVKEQEDCYDVDLDGKPLARCNKFGHSEDVTMCGNIEMDGADGIEVWSINILKDYSDQDLPAVN
ncbi:uncharacterized protein LOC143031371 isoform X1 [Oratosquilla oratoria]|uniref:uncharacterized protein LOC143031371 isoform X1 n=1 Tax=Oratosquilla oratoria TaxID=337810 RepID=UPI003F76919F